MTFRVCEGQKKNRPTCELDIYETKNKERYWKMFSKYHYLSHSHNGAARVFVATLNGDVCGYCSVLHFPHPKIKNLKKAHRVVVLPDFQGMGIGMIMMNKIGYILHNEGFEFAITTSNPALIFSMKNSKDWECTHFGRMSTGSERGIMQNKHVKGSTSAQRCTASFRLGGGGNSYGNLNKWSSSQRITATFKYIGYGKQ